MRVELDISIKTNSTGPWAEVSLVTGTTVDIAPIPVASFPVNPNYREDPLETALLILADHLRDALVGAGQ